MEKLRYEKIGDISSTYPFLEVYFEDENNPFMEIAVNDEKELSFNIYFTDSTIALNLNQWQDILKTAKEFIIKVVKDEDDYQKFLNK